jgi:hypothetical protein
MLLIVNWTCSLYTPPLYSCQHARDSADRPGQLPSLGLVRFGSIGYKSRPTLRADPPCPCRPTLPDQVTSRGPNPMTIAIPRRLALAGLALCACACGCVERRYTIRTDPPGALVYVNGEEVGASPVSKSFTYYGEREVTLVADGHQTARFVQPVNPPWWDNLFTEFFSENLVPFTLRDEREFSYKMLPAVNPPQTDVRQRAETLRGIGRQTPEPQRQGFFGFLGF